MNPQAESPYEESYLNIYEDTRPSPLTNPSSPAVEKTVIPEQNENGVIYRKRTWVITCCFLCLLGIVNVALLVAVMTKQTKVEESKLLENCLELRRNGERNSGIYKIQQFEENVPLEVFCDMETDGGGWSLVASIYEGDINAKCSTDDRWSDYITDYSYTGKSNWENVMIFGDVRNSIFDDYKSSAYFRMKASDVMIWHVPSGISIDLARNQSKLRYRTTNKFLRQYGGNMKNLYSQYFSLSPIKRNVENTVQLLKDISQSLSGVILATTTDFHVYSVDTGQYRISERDMFYTSGNWISFGDSLWSSTLVRYGSEYRDKWDTGTVAVSSIATPFTFLAAIMNDVRESPSYYIRVRSYRKYLGTTVVSKFENSSTLGNFTLHYRAVQYYELDESLHTECRLHFYISNEKEWMSIPPTNFSIARERSRTYNKDLTYSITGRPSRVLFGYMLLSKKSGQNFTSNALDKIAGTIISTVSAYPNLMNEWKAAEPLVVPVTFDRGAKSTVLQDTPTDMQRLIHAGNLQFRAVNYNGYSNALCPGISVNSVYPEYVCVGGMTSNMATCNDFAGWKGDVGGEAVSKPTLLIFYR